METQYARGRFASQTPAWNKDDGIYRLDTTGDVDRYILSPPSIKIICEPLMGISVETNEGWRAKYLPVEDRIALYTKALHIVSFWKLREGLIDLALYRRQIEASGPIAIDEAFADVACSMQPPLTAAEWQLIEVRMPKPSFIHGFCRLMAQGKKLRETELLAAE